MSEESKDSTVATAAPRPQFKKFKKKKSKARLRSRKEEDDDEHDSSAMDAIAQAKKKRKLLNEVLYKKGLDVTLKASSDVAGAAVESTSSAKETDDATDRLRSFAGEGGDATAEGGVLQRKHMSAMEDFIQEKLKQQNVGEEQEETTDVTTNTATDKLYAELASESQKLSQITQSGEGDTGAGGAMLGGTGIAEVTLPADDRIQTIRETQDAVSSFQTSEGKHSSAVPQDFDKTSGTDELLNVPSSYSHNFQLHTQEWVQQKQQEEVVSSPANNQEVHDDSQDGRVGFDMARRRAAQGDVSATAPSQQEKKNRSNDDRAWKNFMTKQKQSRDRY